MIETFYIDVPLRSGGRTLITFHGTRNDLKETLDVLRRRRRQYRITTNVPVEVNLKDV